MFNCSDVQYWLSTLCCCDWITINIGKWFSQRSRSYLLLNSEVTPIFLSCFTYKTDLYKNSSCEFFLWGNSSCIGKCIFMKKMSFNSLLRIEVKHFVNSIDLNCCVKSGSQGQQKSCHRKGWSVLKIYLCLWSLMLLVWFLPYPQKNPFPCQQRHLYYFYILWKPYQITTGNSLID